MVSNSFAEWPSFSLEEADAVRATLLSNKVNYWTGSECRAFETEFAEWTGTRYAIALANGTLALDLALRAFDIGPGDEVIVTPRTFIASVSCVVNAGATPVFADIDENSGNINAQTIAKVLTPKTKAVICVHLAGWPCDMDPIMNLAQSLGIKVIEDCAQAHGARYKGRNVGSIGHIGAWSFCQDKIMTTGGEGGMVTTSDEALWRKMWAYKDHGKSFEAVYERQHPPGFRWLHESFGTNWRMLEVQAVIGRIQLRRMKDWTQIRTSHAQRILGACREFPSIRIPAFACSSCGCEVSLEQSCSRNAESCIHAYYKLYVYIKPECLNTGWTRDRIVEMINAEGVPCYQGSCSEVYLEKAFDETGWRPSSRLPIAKNLGETSFMFLIHPTLSNNEIDQTLAAIRKIMNQAQR
jgi:dTDP-4-amino-4,6-dideoxygalactose transaminase